MHTDTTGHATGVVLVQVNQGDHVYVRKHASGGGCTAVTNDHGRSAFSRLLLYASECLKPSTNINLIMTNITPLAIIRCAVGTHSTRRCIDINIQCSCYTGVC